MNSIIILIIAIPLVEIFLMIKIGHMIGAFNTILLIIFTAITGIYYAKLEGLNTLRSGLNQLIKKLPKMFYQLQIVLQNKMMVKLYF